MDDPAETAAAPQPGPQGPPDGDRPPPALSRRRELWQTVGVFAGATALCAVLWQLRRFVPFIATHLHTLIAIIFLYLPTMLISRRDEDFADYGLTHRPLRRGLLYFGVTSAIIFPLFAVGMFYYYEIVCRLVARGVAMPAAYHRLCARFVGSFRRAHLRLPNDFGQVALAQLIAVALPEEYFFRGYVQTRLDRVWPARRRLLGGPFGWSIIVTSILFALGHVLVDFNGLRLAVFFPSLAFGWMRAATGSILGGVLFHACCNLISELLHTMLF